MKAIVIFSGYNFRAVIAICRYLVMCENQAYIIANGKNDPIYDTKYKNWVVCCREENILNALELNKYFLDILNKSRANRLLIMPTSEYLNRFLLQHIDSFIGIELPLVSLELYEQISNKQSFKAMCNSYNISAPSQKILNIYKPALPVVAKIKTYKMDKNIQVKPYLILTEQDCERFLDKEDPVDFYFEEYISGKSYYLLYSFDKNGNYRFFSQLNRIQQSGGRSIIAATNSDINLDKVALQYINLFQHIGFYGLVMIEIRKSKGNFYMIEANPRVWGPIQFIVDNCPELLDLFFNSNGFKDIKSNNSKPKDYFWFGGYFSDLVNTKPIQFFNDTNQVCLNNISLTHWLQSDVFLQEDTINYFHKELENIMDRGNGSKN